jgi:hypothetical protein
MTTYALLVVLAATLSLLAASVRVHRFSRTHVAVRVTLAGRGLFVNRTPDGVWCAIRVRIRGCSPASWWPDDGPPPSSGVREARCPIGPDRSRRPTRSTRGRTTEAPFRARTAKAGATQIAVPSEVRLARAAEAATSLEPPQENGDKKEMNPRIAPLLQRRVAHGLRQIRSGRARFAA